MILLVLYCGILVSCRSQFVLFESFIFYRGCCVNILDNAQRVRSISETERVRSKQGRTWSCELVHRRITGSNRWINSVRLSFVSIIHTSYITGGLTFESSASQGAHRRCFPGRILGRIGNFRDYVDAASQQRDDTVASRTWFGSSERVFAGFHGLPRLRNLWKPNCTITDGLHTSESWVD